MKRNSLFTKAIALLVCAIMLIGYLPSIALPVAANDFESDIDVVETTEAPTEAPGAESNPIALIFEDNGEGSLVANTEEIPAGATVYYSIKNITGDVTFVGAESYSITYNGATYEAVDQVATVAVESNSYEHAILAITNNDAEDVATLTATYTFPEGTIDNPQDLWEGDNSVTLEAGSQGWYFDYVGYSDGYLTVTVSGENWQYYISNNTTSVVTELRTSADETVVASETMEYHAGEEVVVFVNTFNAEDTWNAPAGSVNVNISFVPGFGTEESPYQLTELENTITVPAGETVWYQGWFNGLEMTVIGENYAVIYNGETVDEVDHMTVTAANPRMPVTFAVTNNGEADAEYQVNFTYPAGTVENPAVAELGDNVVVFEEAPTAEYVWLYEAEKDGELNITVSSDSGDWQYTVTNMTSYVYGDTQWSDSDPVVNPTVLEVAAGDLIQIKVITYDPANPWGAPAGTITTNLAYVCKHENTTTTTVDATCTEAGVVTVVCDDCGEIISETEIPALGHDYTGENGACVNCGEYQLDETLVFYTKAMVLGADIRGVFQVRKMKATSPYESFKVIVEKGGVETELELVATSDRTNYTTYGYALTVPAKEMADVVNAKIIGIKADGTYCVSNPDTWSIKEGVIAIMDSNAAKTDEASVNKMKLCANMLNYGAEAQKKFNYNLENLATDGLKEAYAALIITTTPEMEEIAPTDDTGVAAPLKDIVFNLAARVQVLPRFTVPKADAKESYKAVVNQIHVAPDGTETVYDTVVIEGADCLKSGSTFAVYIDYLAAKELRDVITITLYKGDVQVSATHTFSAESVLSGLMSSYPTLIPALMNFCDCARAVFG